MDNLAEGGSVSEAGGAQVAELIDQQLSTVVTFTSNAVVLEFTFPTPEDGEDSYGIDKVDLYGATQADVTGWEVYYKSIPRSGEEVACAYETDGSVKMSSGTEEEGGWESTTDCGAHNIQTKYVYLKHGAGLNLALKEVVIAGLKSISFPCDTGWQPGTQPCSRCPEGKKGSTATTGEVECVDCSAGQYSSYVDAYDPILECSPCGTGKYSDLGAAVCSECLPGTYQDETEQPSCKQCQAGSSQSLSGKTSCDTCGAGYFSELGASSCTACDVGTVAPDEGSTECSSCEPGFYQSDRGQAVCVACAAGTFTDSEGSAICQPCPTGSYNTDNADKTACVQCEVGHYQSLEGRTTCEACAVGTYASREGRDSCNECPVGQYVGTSGATECTECPAGSFQDTRGSISCKQCEPLQYQDQPGQSSCKPCDEGYVSGPGATECESCPAGTYLEPVSKTCEECSPGTFSSAGATECSPCALMTFQHQSGQAKCSTCPEGKITTVEGSVSCEDCSRGSYRTKNMNSCGECPQGTYSGKTGAVECTACPAGTFGGVGFIECEACPKGTYQDKEGQSECVDCSIGYFSNVEGEPTCTACPVDTVSSETGAYSCTSCSYGYYAPEEGSSKCQKCPKRAAYQPPSCPPVIPNCPKLIIKNVYGNFTWPEIEPPDEGSYYMELKCGFALYENDVKVLYNVSSECRTWFANGDQKSNWTTPSYSKCGTAQTEVIYQQTKVAAQAIAAAGSIEDAVIDTGTATTMLAGLMSTLTTINGDDDTPDPDQDGTTDPNDKEGTEKTSEDNSNKLGAADTANVVKTLAVVANNAPADVLLENQDSILDAINNFAEQDDDFVSDAGSDSASAAVNVVESIGASMFTVPTDNTDTSENSTSNSTDSKSKAKTEIKTDTMTIVPTPLTEDTLSNPVELDFGEDEEDEPTTEAPEEEVNELPATEAPFVPEVVDEDDDEPAPTQAAVLVKITEPPPKPIKKIVKVKMPPLGNIQQASDDKDAQGLVCVVFETSSLFPTNSTAQSEMSTGGSGSSTSASATKSGVASKVVLLSFGSKSISNIDPPLALNFTKEDPEDYDPSSQSLSFKCTYYEKDTQTWSSEGCKTVAVDMSRGGQVSCECNHMTSFAVLMSLEPIPDYLEEIQSRITNPLLGFSLFCLFLMIGTILPFKQLRSTRSMKIHLSLAGSQCFAIIVFLLTNLDSVISGKVESLCIMIAILTDYSYLVVFMWTLVESVIMYISLVQVFGGHISKYMLKFNLFCWITPLLSPLTDYFLTEGVLLESGSCMVNREIRKFSFILPIAVILTINFLIFCTLLKVIARAKNPEKSTVANTMKQLKAVASISCLLGLGWMVAFFMQGSIAPYFQFAFIFINGTQGFLMFLFYCIGNEQYMDCWKAKFGIEVKKKSATTSSSAARSRSTVQQSTVTAPSAVVPIAAAASPQQPKPAEAVPAPEPAKPAAIVCPTPKPNAEGGGGRRRRTRASAAPEPEKLKKFDPEENSSAIYENENVYDIIDDPDIKPQSPATITRI